MRDEHKNVDFFLGKEVERTPAFGFKTLFIVGLQEVEKIDKVLQDPFTNVGEAVNHLYFGADQSFSIPENTNSQNWLAWTKIISNYLNQGFWCTLDIDVKHVVGLNESGLCEHDLFIPMISVPIPHIRGLNYNATLKIDDQSMKFSNPGVWCHSLHSLQSRDAFTDWTAYSKDTVLK